MFRACVTAVTARNRLPEAVMSDQHLVILSFEHHRRDESSADRIKRASERMRREILRPLSDEFATQPAQMCARCPEHQVVSCDLKTARVFLKQSARRPILPAPAPCVSICLTWYRAEVAWITDTSLVADVCSSPAAAGTLSAAAETKSTTPPQFQMHAER